MVRQSTSLALLAKLSAPLLAVLLALAVAVPDAPTAWGSDATSVAATEGFKPAARGRRAAGHVLVAWSPLNLPRKTERVLDRIRRVRATTVLSSLGWMRSARTRSERTLERVRGGYGIPIDAAFVEPREYASFVPKSERGAIRRLGRRKGLVSRTERKLRGGHGKLRMRISGTPVRTFGAVPDGAAKAYEVLLRKPAPRSWGAPSRSFLIRKPKGVSQRRLRRAIMRLVGRGHPLRIAGRRETRWLRYGEVVTPLAFVKRAFGEFAARPSGGGALQIRPRWVKRNIRHRRVPILGNVTCHRRLFHQLRRALGELRRKRLSHLVRRSEYAGCYNPRFIATSAGKRISRHTYGIALDINAASNPFGARPHQGKKLVRVMRKWGFNWGGRWPLPDGMHFEWRRFP